MIKFKKKNYVVELNCTNCLLINAQYNPCLWFGDLVTTISIHV